MRGSTDRVGAVAQTAVQVLSAVASPKRPGCCSSMTGDGRAARRQRLLIAAHDATLISTGRQDLWAAISPTSSPRCCSSRPTSPATLPFEQSGRLSGSPSPFVDELVSSLRGRKTALVPLCHRSADEYGGPVNHCVLAIMLQHNVFGANLMAYNSWCRVFRTAVRLAIGELQAMSHETCTSAVQVQLSVRRCSET
jgi:hypothetical protein